MHLLKNILTAATVTLFVTPLNAYFSGVKNSLDIAVIEQAKDVYFNEIVKMINHIELPDIYLPDDKGYMLGNKFVLTS